MATWSLGHSLMANLPLCLVHVFPIVLPWLLVCIYSPPPVVATPTNEFPSPLLLVPQSSPALVSNSSHCVPTRPIVSLILSRSRSVIPKLVLALSTQCGDVSPVQIDGVCDLIPSHVPASLVQPLIVPRCPYSSLIIPTRPSSSLSHPYSSLPPPYHWLLLNQANPCSTSFPNSEADHRAF